MRRDDGAKVESGAVLKRPMEVVEIKEGMPIKWWSVWETMRSKTVGDNTINELIETGWEACTVEHCY